MKFEVFLGLLLISLGITGCTLESTQDLSKERGSGYENLTDFDVMNSTCVSVGGTLIVTLNNSAAIWALCDREGTDVLFTYQKSSRKLSLKEVPK